MKFFAPEWIILGLAVTAALVITALVLRRKRVRRARLRAANTARFRALPAYRRKKLESLLYRTALTAGLIASLAAAVLLAARPYESNTVQEEIDAKDIFLCMDVSASSCQGVAGFVEEFRDMVPALEGDQIGISLFNTSSMQYVPVTDDYRFLLQRLDELAAYFSAADEFRRDYTDVYSFVHEIPESRRARYEALNAVLSAFDRGTTAGYEVKGTSIVSEGLASCLFSFPELYTQPRPRIILLVTDNLPQCVGEPLTTLAEAAQMCAYNDVVVYGIYPAVEAADTEAETGLAKDGLKAAAEATGGMFFDLGGSAGPAEILEEIRKREKTVSKTVIAMQDMDRPEGWRVLLFTGLGVALAALLFLLIKNGRLFRAWPARKIAAAAAVFAASAACAVLIGIRPMRVDRSMDIRTTNLDVCFAVDTTISMWAEDFDGQEQRMDGVRADVNRIITALPGSSFSLVRFDNGAQVMAPYIRNITVVQDCMDAIDPPSYAIAEGSSPNIVHDTLASMIKASKEKEGARKTIVFLFSDGEITNGLSLMRFNDLEGGIDQGAVLGYGTADGGRMQYPGIGYLRDTTRRTDARSVIDEANLKSIAKDLGVSYLHRERKETLQLDQVLNRIRRLSLNTSLKNGDRTGWKETYYYFARILALILAGCLFRLIRRGSLL